MNETFLATAGALVEQANTGANFNITFKSVFGAVAAYADSNIFLTCGTFGIAVKLDNATCISIINEGDGEPLKYFAKGHVKKGYVVLSNDILNDPARLNDLVNAATAYVQERYFTLSPPIWVRRMMRC